MIMKYLFEIFSVLTEVYLELRFISNSISLFIVPSKSVFNLFNGISYSQCLNSSNTLYLFGIFNSNS